MARTKKNDKAAVFAKMAAFLAEKNIEAPVVDQDTLDSIDDRDYGSSDAALLFAHHPAGFTPGVCKNCGALYLVNRKSVGFCSDPCRREDWRKTTGLPWSAVSTHDIWDGAPPHIISPEQVQKLAGIAEWFNTNRTTLDILAEKDRESREAEAATDPWGVPVVEDPALPANHQFAYIGDFASLGLESDQTNSLQTNPPDGPSAPSLELSDEEASLFEF